jgi:hypothetical protein
VSRCMRQMMVIPDLDCSFKSTPLPFLKMYFWPTDAYLYSQSCEIHRRGPKELISIDWFPYMNCNSVKSLKLLRVVFIFLFSIYDHNPGKHQLIRRRLYTECTKH